MSNYLCFYTDGQGYIRIGGLGTTTGDSAVLPSNSVDADTFPLPDPLNQVCSTWGQAFEYQLTQFYIANAQYELSLVPMDEYYQCLSMTSTDELSMYYLNLSGYPGFYTISSPQLLNFLSLAYPGKEVSAPISWDDINQQGVNIITSLTPWINSSIATGTPVDPSVVAVQAVAANPQSAYNTPDEAYVYFRQGAAGLALNLGVSWPPPLA